MKKFLTLLTSAVLVLSVSSCGEKNEESSEETIILPNPEPVAAEVIQPFIDYFDGYNENDPDKIIESVTPQIFIDGLKEAGSYDDLYAETSDSIQATIDYWTETYGADPIASYVGEIENKTLTEKQMELAELSIKYTYFNIKKDFDIEEGYEVKFNYKTEGADSSADAEETACFVKIKDDGWKLIALSAAGLTQYDGAKDPYNMDVAEE